jgi:hypothetical protein
MSFIVITKRINRYNHRMWNIDHAIASEITAEYQLLTPYTRRNMRKRYTAKQI